MKIIKVGSAIVATLTLASCFGANLDQATAFMAVVIAFLDLGTCQVSGSEKGDANAK